MTTRTLCRTLAALGGLLFAATAWTSPVGFDNTFGSNGKVFANLSYGTSDDIAQAVAIQPDGAMVMAGTCQTGSTRDFCVARFLTNGDLDPSFGSGGKVVTPVGVGDDVARAVTLDGTRIVVAGSCTQGGDTDFCVARYLANGALDTSFNGTGTVITPVGLLADQAYAVAMDGTRILVGGECEVAGLTDSCLVRFLADGTLDPAYGSGGKVILSLVASLDGIRGLALTGGKAIVAARCSESDGKFCVARFNADGTLDTGFGTSGTVITLLSPFAGIQRFDNPNALSLMTDGRIVVAGQCRDGTFNDHMCALVLNGDGTPSSAVNGNGQVILTVATTSAAAATGVATVSNNAMYLSGPCTVSGVQRFCVAALNGLGGLSSSFNGGQPLVDALNLSVDAVANAVAAVFDTSTLNTDISVVGACGGAFFHDFCAARYRQSGARLTSFGVFGVKVQELTLGRFSDAVEGIVRQADGRIIAAGTCSSNRACLARFNADGSLDTSFATGGIYIGAVGSSQGLGARVGMDGTGIVYATQIAATLRVTRLLANGAPDPSWGGGTGTIAPALPVETSKIAGVAAVAGGVIVGFTCSATFPLYDFCIVKLTASGALDASFNASGSLPGLRRESFGAADTAETMALDGGSIVMAGNCRVSSNFDPCVMRFTSAGVPDTTFSGTGKRSLPMGTTDANILGISVSAGVITVGGGCTPGSKEDFCLARLNANGTLDTTFNGTGMATLSLGLFASRVEGLVADGTGVVVAGSCAKDALGQNNDICLARFGAGGILDVDFNGSGTLRTQVGSGVGAARVTQMVRDGSRFIASVQCLPPNGDGLNDFCLAAYLQLPASLPGAPAITAVLAGDTQATVSFVPPVSNGGNAITSYTATCGTRSASGPGSPLTVTGLLNGVSVGCAVTATNSAGTGPASDPPVNVTPLKGSAVTLTASVNPSSASGEVRFFASVTGQGPTGTVEFKLPGGAHVPGCTGPFPIVSGVATCIDNTFATPGTYSIRAHYSGDPANTPAVSAALSHTVIATFEQLTVVKLGTGSATVTSAPAAIACGATCTAQYATNMAVTLTATPATGTVVQSWSGCDAGTGNECIVNMLGSRTVQLTLALQQFALTVSTTGAGSGAVTSSPAGINCGATCSASFAAATLVTLTATPAAGSSFTGWSGACAGTGACQVTMDAAKSATATFAVVPAPVTTFLLSVARAGDGTGTVTSSPAAIDCGASCASTFDAATLVTLTATPAAGSSFTGWSGACAGTGACQVTMNAAKSATATFAVVPAPVTTFLLSVASAGGGTGTVTSSPAGIQCGATCASSFDAAILVTLTATPAAGSSFTGWSGACAGTGTCQVTMDAAKSATATFMLLTDIPRLANISTRMQVLTGNNVMIGGFVIGGSVNKTVAIVATGPSLAAFGIANPLADPTLQLVRSSDQSVIATNDNWGSAANAAQLQAVGFAPSNALESAILVSLPPGAYTAIVSGVGGGTGVGIVAVYEVDHPEVPLINISTRGQVLTGNDVMIGGFVIQGSGPQTVVVVATGPSLAAFGIANALANPALQLVRSSDQAVIASNDDWGSAANAAQIQAAGFAPSNALESAILVTLNPGAYTVVVSGVGGGTGVGVIAVYTTP